MPTSKFAISYPLLALLLALLNAIGPFTIDTYLPAFPAIAQDLGTDALGVQQSLTAYMLPFAFMMLWHGAIADAIGRRKVLLVGMGLFVLASIVCVSAQSITMLWIGRGLQGLSAGVGVVVGRAIIRDVLEGPAAQRLMAHVTMVFAVAPAIAPILGGALSAQFGWRSIFVFLALFGLLQILLTAIYLPETLAPQDRQSLHPVELLAAYKSVLGDPAFVLAALAQGLMFAGFFVYVMSAPVFLIDHLGLASTEFAWMFIPLVIGMMSGAMLSARLAGKRTRESTAMLGFGVMGFAVTINLLLNYFAPTMIATRIPQLTIYTLGLSLAMPCLSLLGLDLFPARRGMASSCQSFIHMLVTALCAGVYAPLLWSNLHHLAWGGAAALATSFACFVLFERIQAKRQP